jgi:hypothetical protein
MSDEDDRDADTGPDDGEGPESKVARMIEAYDLGAEFGARLEALWTAEGDERESLRSLADRFNRRLLEAELADAGTATLDGEVRNLYRLLTSDGVSSGVCTETRKRLERDGIDVGELERDFVSYQAIRSYLTAYRGAEYEGHGGSERIENVVATTRRLQSRIRSVAEKNLRQLRDTDRLTLGEFRLFVEVDVLCEDCGTQYGLVELLERGGCECE